MMSPSTKLSKSTLMKNSSINNHGRQVSIPARSQKNSSNGFNPSSYYCIFHDEFLNYMYYHRLCSASD